MHQSSRLGRVFMAVLGLVAAACSDAGTPTNPVVAPVVAPTTCTTPQTLAVGGVSAGMTGTSACIGGVPAAAEYALVAFNGKIVPDTSSFTVTATGATAPSAQADLLSAGSSATLSVLATPATTFQRSRSFEIGLRMRERAVLTPLISSARTWVRARSGAHPAFDVIPSSVTVGQILRLNANSSVACGSPTYRGGRVVAVTNKAIVVADTLNPTGGYTDAEYASLGATFDTLVDPLARSAFGAPTDIDGNGRVLMFFTKTVNDLTPTTSTSYVGGFFFARDLFPQVATPTYNACDGSNMGEMFYIMVPDPSRGGAFTKTNVATEVPGTLAHEYQHLINASRRMYVNNAIDFEESWLDEGLAHEAEELLFYRVSGLSPRQDIDPTAIRATSATVSAFNNYESSNFGRFEDYLGKPSDYSAYADNDSLATRGASWAFLRYAADHRGASDGTTWYELVNSVNSGFANLAGVFGSGVTNELRDWGVSVIADDLTGVGTAYQQPSWNFRSMYAALLNSSVFPLVEPSLGSGSHAVRLVRGANAYLRFAVAAGGSATVSWTGAPSAVQFSLVRLK